MHLINKMQQFKKSMQARGIDIDNFVTEERLSSKILEKIVGGGDSVKLCCSHDRSKDDAHDRSVHDKQHDKGIFTDKCTHQKV